MACRGCHKRIAGARFREAGGLENGGDGGLSTLGSGKNLRQPVVQRIAEQASLQGAPRASQAAIQAAGTSISASTLLPCANRSCAVAKMRCGSFCEPSSAIWAQRWRTAVLAKRLPSACV